ncbi:unnamed protein product [Peronospora farinosa]|uniref:WRKY19-like zinc finger domain-containing protein n=1 Tax=Peronospora farinosa TaxID=134698 RepID=A0AAV0STQ5_9STRA|nr:unnamed protein product [Peronospora farinosa]CAI5705612.1 unnamed protein product [Peronospora farinosa]
MITKSQLDFILNPMETPQHEPLTDTLLSKSPIWTSISPNSVSGWNEEHALLYYPHTSNLHHRCDTHQLPSPVMSLPCQLVLPSIFTRSATVSSPINVSTAMNFEKEKSYLDSPKKFLSFLSHKKRTRKCNEKGCPSLVVSRRRCVRHGGGSRCTYEGCTNGAKLRSRCFQHGGCAICQASGCNSKAKRYGYCWSHGGGLICSAEGCLKVAAQGGSCWAHGGGNRCKLESCSKRSYQKYGYYCKAHACYNV